MGYHGCAEVRVLVMILLTQDIVLLILLSYIIMKRILTDKESNSLEKRIAEVEKNTGAQIVLAVVGRSDSYAEIPWKVFALAVSMTGLFIYAFNLLWPGRCSSATVLVSIVFILIIGITAALFSVYFPWFARFFLASHRAETEVRQYAESFFLTNELFSTSYRTGILLLISLFERKVILLPDKGIGGKLSHAEMQKVIEEMKPFLASRQVYHALENGLDVLGKLLVDKNLKESGRNELPDMIIEEKGG